MDYVRDCQHGEMNVLSIVLTVTRVIKYWLVYGLCTWLQIGEVNVLTVSNDKPVVLLHLHECLGIEDFQDIVVCYVLKLIQLLDIDIGIYI